MHLLKKEEVRARLKISQTTLDRMVKEGRITPVRLGPRLVRFTEESLSQLFSVTEHDEHQPTSSHL